MQALVRIVVAVAAILSCLIAAASTKASDRDRIAERMWDELVRGCNKAAALKDIERSLPMVVPEAKYELMRDIYARHLCSERELKADLEAATRDNEAMARAPSAAPACRPTSLQNCTCGPQLATALAQSLERANPGGDQLVKAMALRQGLELMGCIAPQPAPPPRQTTDCIPLGDGFRCTTR